MVVETEAEVEVVAETKALETEAEMERQTRVDALPRGPEEKAEKIKKVKSPTVS